MKKLMLLAGLMALVTFGAAHAAPRAVNLCTGGAGGAYDTAGKAIAQFAKGDPSITINVVNTNGTWDNIQKTALGEDCDAMIGQPDGWVLLKRQNSGAARSLKPISDLHREYLHVLCSKESGISDLKKLGKTNSIALGDTGSGSWLVWQNIVANASSYGEIPVTNESDVVALSSVASNQTTCMLVPGALGAPLVQKADTMFGDDVVLGGASDWSFNNATDANGKVLYDFNKIPSGSYPTALQTGWFGSSVETISWTAKVYINTDHLSDQKELSAFITAVARAKAGIVAQYGK